MHIRHLLPSLGLAFLLIPGMASADQIVGTGGASFDSGTGDLTVSGTITVGPGALPLAPFTIVLPLVQDNGAQAVFGSAGNPGSIDIQTGLLSAQVDFINVAFPNYDFGSPGLEVLSYTLGGIGSESGLMITGGSESGAVSSSGTFSILLDQISWVTVPNSAFDGIWFANSFSSDARVEMETAPEPGSFLLVATGLGLMIGARRRRQI